LCSNRTAMFKRTSLVFLLLLFVTFCSLAQKKVRFKAAYQPGKTYLSEMNMTTLSEMNFEGDEAVINQIKASGMSLPMIVEMKQLMNVKTQTGTEKHVKGLPVVITYDKVETNQKMNGQEFNAPNELQNTKIEGWMNPAGQVEIDSIYGEMKEEMRTLLGDMIKEMQKQVAFPDRDLKVGDKFTEEKPLIIPMMGGIKMNMVVSITYLLKEIKSNMARFDIDQTITLDFSIEQKQASGSGKGSGNMVYDMKQDFVTSYFTDTEMDMKMLMDQMTLLAKSKTQVDMKISIN
jgi:hypothetical protein